MALLGIGNTPVDVDRALTACHSDVHSNGMNCHKKKLPLATRTEFHRPSSGSTFMVSIDAKKLSICSVKLKSANCESNERNCSSLASDGFGNKSRKDKIKTI